MARAAGALQASSGQQLVVTSTITFDASSPASIKEELRNKLVAIRDNASPPSIFVLFAPVDAVATVLQVASEESMIGPTFFWVVRTYNAIMYLAGCFS